MSDSDSPSALLERAAALIEQRAAEAFASKDTPIIDGNPPWTDWYLMFEPDEVAQPLVEWLRYAGAQYEVAERRVRLHHARDVENWVSGSDRAALAFARQVLGES